MQQFAKLFISPSWRFIAVSWCNSWSFESIFQPSCTLWVISCHCSLAQTKTWKNGLSNPTIMVSCHSYVSWLGNSAKNNEILWELYDLCGSFLGQKPHLNLESVKIYSYSKIELLIFPYVMQLLAQQDNLKQKYCLHQLHNSIIKWRVIPGTRKTAVHTFLASLNIPVQKI